MLELAEGIKAQGWVLDTCVCLGAGNGELPAALAALAPARLVLLEVAPHTAAALAEQAAAWPGAEVHPLAVAPEAGTLPWLEYNLPAFNGPLDAAPLARYFPRLRQVGSTTRPAAALAPWLATLNLAPAPTGRTHLLVLNLPGQELALLQALPAELLELFGAVALRGCTEVAYAQGSSLPAVLEFMQAKGFALAAAPSAEPLWPTAVLHLDARAQAERPLARRLRTLEDTLAATRQAHAEEVQALAQARRDRKSVV